MRTALTLFIAAVMLLPGCLGSRAGLGRTAKDRAYIDSLGYQDFFMRQQVLGKGLFESPEKTVKEALGMAADSASVSPADSAVFAALERNYQRYLHIFRVRKGGGELTCSYDLVETFEKEIFDPQPFLNAILHKLSLVDLTTLDYSKQLLSDDRMRVIVYWSAPSSKPGEVFTVTEGEQGLEVSRHTIQLE